MKSLPRTLAILAFAVAMTVTAQKDSSMSPRAQLSTFDSPLSTPGIPFWRLDSVTTNAAVSYERPAGSGRNEYWWKRGGIETAFRFHLDGFTFPLGTNDVTSLMATAFGAVRAFARRPETEILASANRLAAEPLQSEFWYGCGTNANYFLTWRNFRFVEPPHDWVNAQGDWIPRRCWVNMIEVVRRAFDITIPMQLRRQSLHGASCVARFGMQPVWTFHSVRSLALYTWTPFAR